MIFDGFEERLKAALRDETAYSLSKRCGISESLIRKYISGKSIPSIERAWRLARALDVSLDWLADGDMESLPEKPSITEDDVFAYLPLYDDRLNSGHRDWSASAKVLGKVAFTRHSLREKGLDADHLSVVRVSGALSEPALHEGDTVLVDHSRRAVDLGGYFVILINKRLYAKRLQRQFDGSITVISASQDYQDMTIPKEQVADLVIIGSVAWQGRWFV
ncbi:XRE family transcriptional regulator [Pseudomonas nitroreducens]|uniref:XRE family transcriptional regulator n=1 Tax=Pseudomonas nitroreducens TaxID=46680 RepID=UPI002D7FE9FB|nr:LexA family transcriptional regulator [Pseudomonas nitroreducens]